MNNNNNKGKKLGGIILAALGVVFLLAGIAIIVIGGNASRLEQAEPVDVYLADETDQYVFANVQYMTESVAYFEAMENMQFYIACDENWNPAVICMHADDVAQYQPYIDWLYSDSYDDGPEEVSVTGYAQPFDAELEELVLEGFEECFGEGIIDESSFADWFGNYYLQVGQKNGAYRIASDGIYLLLAAAVLLTVGACLLYEKPAEQTENAGPVIQDSHTGRGVLGAALGALLGGLLWTVVEALGYVSGWIGALIIFMSYKGYEMFARKKDTLGVVVSLVFGILVIIPATYLSYGWMYYCNVNESVSGYITLTRALIELPSFLTAVDGWSSFAGDLIIGYAVMILIGIVMFAGRKFGKYKKNSTGNGIG